VILVHLYDLQVLDTTLEQLRHQFITLPEREALALVQKNAADCTAKISSGEMRQQELEKLLSAAEATSATLRKKRERLEQQMKTVIAPREAEALQHEISAVGSEIDAVVDQYTKMIGENAPLTVAASKFNIRQVCAHPEEQDMERAVQMVKNCFASEDFKEGRTAFMEKRPAQFKGR
jgi:predicted  nucleic acid-binding Zn-ribbon protein